MNDLKARIYFALKDPDLKLGFELLCQRLDSAERLYNDML